MTRNANLCIAANSTLFQYLPGDAGVGTDLIIVHFPLAQLFHLRILEWHDAN